MFPSCPEDSSSQSAAVETGEKKKMNALNVNYDEILTHIGQIGRYSLLTFLPLCFAFLFPGAIVQSYNFIGGVPKYRSLLST